MEWYIRVWNFIDLIHLDLSWNYLEIVKVEYFRANSFLKYLILNNNNIKLIESRAFIWNEDLYWLHLTCNNLTTLTISPFFDKIVNREFNLFLGFNSIQTLFFKSELRIINVTENRLREIPATPIL
jgi:hypothetical protein